MGYKEEVGDGGVDADSIGSVQDVSQDFRERRKLFHFGAHRYLLIYYFSYPCIPPWSSPYAISYNTPYNNHSQADST